jgi:DNA topoisomerase-1
VPTIRLDERQSREAEKGDSFGGTVTALAEVRDLRFTHGFDAGLSRKGSPGSFAYVGPDGSVISDPATLEHIHTLAIPPAWTSVWIAPEADAHLQATGTDRRGRKQYRYHASWQQERDALKYRDMEDFARIQPALRSRISSELTADRELSHLRVLALALRLLDVGLFRIGSDRYARDNAHYGLTTLLLDQLTIRGGSASFDYVGKAGRAQHLTINDAEALAALSALKRRRSGPRELLAFRGPRGWTRIHREDVNNFLRVQAAGPFSAKEYRTWNATVIAAVQLAELRPAPSRAPTVASLAVAEALGNTPAVARRSYIDPRIFSLYAAGHSIELDHLPDGSWQRRAELEARVLTTLAQAEIDV